MGYSKKELGGKASNVKVHERVGKADAFWHKSLWTMRNAQAEYWASYDADGNVKVEINAHDYFNVTPQFEKGDTYNRIAIPLNKLHQAAGGYPGMQTRASWTRTIKR